MYNNLRSDVPIWSAIICNLLWHVVGMWLLFLIGLLDLIGI